VCVVGDEAHLDWREQRRPDQSPDTPARGCSFRVSARSLLLALRAAWDDEHPGTSELDQTGRPLNAGQPWTTEQDTQLRVRFLNRGVQFPDCAALRWAASTCSRGTVDVTNRSP
jgi:hypothetical protein